MPEDRLPYVHVAIDAAEIARERAERERWNAWRLKLEEKKSRTAPPDYRPSWQPYIPPYGPMPYGSPLAGQPFYGPYGADPAYSHYPYPANPYGWGMDALDAMYGMDPHYAGYGIPGGPSPYGALGPWGDERVSLSPSGLPYLASFERPYDPRYPGWEHQRSDVIGYPPRDRRYQPYGIDDYAYSDSDDADDFDDWEDPDDQDDLEDFDEELDGPLEYDARPMGRRWDMSHYHAVPNGLDRFERNRWLLPSGERASSNANASRKGWDSQSGRTSSGPVANAANPYRASAGQKAPVGKGATGYQPRGAMGSNSGNINARMQKPGVQQRPRGNAMAAGRASGNARPNARVGASATRNANPTPNRNQPRLPQRQRTAARQPAPRRSYLLDSRAGSIHEEMRGAAERHGRKRKRLLIVLILALIALAVGAVIALNAFGVIELPGLPAVGGSDTQTSQDLDEGQSAGSADQSSASSSSSSSSSTSSSSSSSGASSSQSGEGEGSVTYNYTATTPQNVAYTAEETVQFGPNGECQSTTMRMEFPDAESAQAHVDGLKRDYGSNIQIDSQDGAVVVVTIDNSGLHLNREKYENSLRYSVSDLAIVKK